VEGKVFQLNVRMNFILEENKYSAWTPLKLITIFWVFCGNWFPFHLPFMQDVGVSILCNDRVGEFAPATELNKALEDNQVKFNWKTANPPLSSSHLN
jgi:hypothetical protein